MLNSTYFDVMRETCREVDPVIQEYVSGTDEAISRLPLRRVGHPKLRDLVVRLGYELAGGQNWREIVPVCASYELLNCSTYVINWIFDEKEGEKTKPETDDLIMAGFQLREIAECVLRDFGLKGLVKSICNINRAVYDGQNIDLNILNAQNANNFPTLDEFMKIYEKRCSNLSGVFYGNCLFAGSVLLGRDNLSLYDVGFALGTGGQASNDLGDFAIPGGGIKGLPYKDQLSDLRLGRLTLPLYLLLTRSLSDDRKTIESMIGKRELTQDDFEKVMDIFCKTKTFEVCFNLLKQKHKRAKTMLYDSFPKTAVRDLVAEMLVGIVSNKFLKGLRDDLEK